MPCIAGGFFLKKQRQKVLQTKSVNLYMKQLQSESDLKVGGFTLLEILVSIFILATVLSTVFASYTATFRVVNETESMAEVYHMARIAFERILEDLESVYVSEKNETSEEMDDEESPYVFEGKNEDVNGQNADSMSFPSHAHLVFGEEDQHGGIANIAYYVEEDADGEALVLFRSDTLQLAEASEEGQGGLPLCEKLASVDFSYVDSEGEEQEDWGPEDGIPKMVSISLGFLNPSDPENPLMFVTKVAVPSTGVEENKE